MAEDSPNEQIDKALKELMKRVTKTPAGEMPVEIGDAVKVVNSAIAWEKVKHQINGTDDGFDPTEL
jgi:hypothetical protein